ncbi:MAG: hypothetical protein ACXVDN_21995, partial [Ktedonobacteraceae bacterium]
LTATRATSCRTKIIHAQDFRHIDGWRYGSFRQPHECISARGHPDVGEKMCSCLPTQDQCIQHQDGTVRALLSEPRAFDLELASLRKLAPAPSLPFLLEYFDRRLLQKFRCRPSVHIEVVLDVAVAEHEIFADLDALHVLRTQAWHHVNVLDAL